MSTGRARRPAAVSALRHRENRRPFFFGDRLDGQARVLDERHLAECGLLLHLGERHRSREGLVCRDVHTFPRAAVIGRVGMGRLHHRHDADDLLGVHRMVEEPFVALRHLAHLVARHVVAHAVPLRAGRPRSDLIVPTPCSRLGFEQPIAHDGPLVSGLRIRQPHYNATAFCLGSPCVHGAGSAGAHRLARLLKGLGVDRRLAPSQPTVEI